MSYGLHVIKFPVGTYGYVGSVPTDLATVVDATKSDVLGGRAFFDDEKSLKSYKFPSFPTKDGAIKFAESKGYTVIQD